MDMGFARPARKLAIGLFVVAGVALEAQPSRASLLLSDLYTGSVGLSVDAAGSNDAATGTLTAAVPATATVLKAYLYAAGTPFPWYANSPTSLADYNGSGITLNGTAVNNFDHLVGATSTRADIGAWYTGRADVTGIVAAARLADLISPTLNLSYTEGTLNNRIDGGVLVVVFNNFGLPSGSVAILDGGQNTGGETSTVNFGSPLSDPSAPGFVADMSLAISFSCCGSQRSNVNINGVSLTTQAGNLDDGAVQSDGSLITAGGVGDPYSNGASYANDHEFYDLRPFLSTGDTSFSIFTQNPSNDDNIFFMGLYTTATISDVVTPGTSVPEPSTLALLGTALAGLGALRRRRKVTKAA